MQLLVKFPLIYSAVQKQIMIWGEGIISIQDLYSFNS